MWIFGSSGAPAAPRFSSAMNSFLLVDESN
jgi:hypothetical protein